MDHARRSSVVARVLAHGLASLALALAALVAPAAVPTVQAAEQLLLEASATYTVQPAQHRVHVAVDVRATSLRPATANLIYYYASAIFGIQEEASGVRASRAGQALRTKVSTKADFKVLEVFFGLPLYFEHSTSFRFEYELPGGAPRSSSQIRVGQAFTAFSAWAFGDRDSVRIVFPAGFDPIPHGSAMQRSDDSDAPVLIRTGITPADPFYVYVTADRKAGLEQDDITVRVFDRPRLVSIYSWPEDPEWRTQVSDLLERGIPELSDMIGFRWHFVVDPEVHEVYSPLLEGYAGIYVSSTKRVFISEDLSARVILHEASHTWFNDLFLIKERWINEGLADEYSSRAAVRLNAGTFAPPPVGPYDPSAFPLETWGNPSPIGNDTKLRAHEQYGYDASWTVIRELTSQLGEDTMRKVLQALAGHQIAYLANGRGEGTLAQVTDWRRFLDLIEERGRIEAADLFRTWVLPDAMAPLLDARAATRQAYAALQDRAGGWAPPYAVREPLSSWDFARAGTRIAEAGRVLDRRNDLERRAGALDLTLPDALEKAYEGAQQDFGGIVAIADEEAGTLDRLDEATRAVAAPRDAFAELGLAGDPDPQLALDAARAAFEGDQMAISGDDAGAAITAVAAAPERGRQRAAAGGAGILLFVIGGVSLMIVRRRRRRPGLAPVAATLAPTEATTERGNGEEH